MKYPYGTVVKVGWGANPDRLIVMVLADDGNAARTDEAIFAPDDKNLLGLVLLNSDDTGPWFPLDGTCAVPRDTIEVLE